MNIRRISKTLQSTTFTTLINDVDVIFHLERARQCLLPYVSKIVVTYLRVNIFKMKLTVSGKYMNASDYSMLTMIYE